MPVPTEYRRARRACRWFYIAPVLALLALTAFSAFVTVGPGRRGVVTVFGQVQDRILDEGLHVVVPYVTRVVKIDVQVQKLETLADAASRDLQTILSTIALNYRVDPSTANRVYQTLGLAYQGRIIEPSIQEAVKAVTARYTAEELITKRQVVGQEIKGLLSERLLPFGLLVENFSVVNFEFSSAFNEAIEAKQTAEQLALKAQRDLDRVRIEAQQKIAQAEAEAEALRIQREQVTPSMIELRRIEAAMKAIEKWDGKLPNVTGGAVPFIDVTK